jgi:MYXO-CTERM domain-containing protein
MRALASVGAFGFSVMLASSALADDCPPGSIFRNQDGYTFCEPTVCTNDGMCNPNEVCRPIPLCMQVGTLSADASALTDASKRLVVTQRCGPDKQCPQTTVCSDMSRCISKAQADKMGLLTVASAAPSSSSSSSTGTDAGGKKSSCGCRTVGEINDPSSTKLAAATAVLGLALLSRRRRRHTSR